MQRFFIAILLGGLAIGGASAQTSTDTAPPEAPAAAEPAPPAEAPPAAAAPTKGQEIKQIREQCREEAKAKGLRGGDRMAAVQECFAKARPDLAKLVECRKEGKAKGLADRDLRLFVRKCKNAAQ